MRTAARLRHPIAIAAAFLALPLMILGSGAAQAAPKPPNTVISSGPAAVTSSTTATFAFSATGGGGTATFTCKLDAGTATACTSPKSYTGVAQGSHTFSVFATVAGRSDPTPATTTWTVDTTAPTVPSGLVATTPNATSAALTWSASTDNVAVAGYDVFRDTVLLTSLGTVLTYTDTTVLAGSTHTYAVRARDTAGNLSALSPTVSATTTGPPDTVIDSGPAAATSGTGASFAFHATLTGATFTCKLDAGTAAACTSPMAYTGVAQGSHTFSVFATVNGVSDASPATATWTVDTTAPTVPGGLGATTPDPSSVALTWSASTDNVAVAGYDVFRDTVLLTSLGTVLTYTDTTVLAGSTHTYAVRARDTAGNLSALSPAVSATTVAPTDLHLTRAPYLTDLVGLHVTVNFATDKSSSKAAVAFGAVAADGTCNPTTQVVPTSLVVAINSTTSYYQWKAPLTLPAAGTYCYRMFLSGVDLLAGNPSPTFTTQVQPGSTEAYSFDVLGDWGQVDASGNNPAQAALMSRIASSGARFAITTGDNGYPSGSEQNYGDLVNTGADTSAIFGPAFWPVPGKSLPIFPAIGNHGLARSDAVHPHFLNWPQDTAVATSGGRYQSDSYPSVNGSTVATYPSPWYAFDAGGARFYVLDAAWADLNVGTADAYTNDAASHWSPTSPEYIWLKNDLAAHPSGLKMAFFHYPLYSDQPSENSDTALQGAASLEGLLTTYGVNLAFSGHAHIYQRSTGLNGLVSYTTGGGGADIQSTGTCSTNDKYAVGWSGTNSAGTACGTAAPPSSAAQVYHFLNVSISGSQVTVTPTDSTGRTFDVQTYTFQAAPDTYIDSGPAVPGTTSTSATFAFHASGSPATFACTLDAGATTACTSPITYTNLTQNAHTFTVTATVGTTDDPLPATWNWTVDTSAPAAPTGLAGTASSPFAVDLSWTAATDNLGVTGYNVYRDGTLLQTITPATTFSDTSVLSSSTYQYAVAAVDVAGNVSPQTSPVTVVTPAPPPALFADGFESGTLSAWDSSAGLVVETATVHGGTHAAEGNTTNGTTYAKKAIGAAYPDAYARVAFDAVSQVDQINLLRMRDGAGNSLGYVYLATTGQLGFHNDALNTNALSATVPAAGWHSLELHLRADPTPGATGVVEVWLDNTLVTDLSSTAVDVGAAQTAAFQIGETQAGRTYDVVFDDAAFGSSRLGPVGDTTPPSVPANVVATAPSAFVVQVGWDASTDDVGVAGYDVYRDGVLAASVGAVTTWTDTTVQAQSMHVYAVLARDGAGNTSALSPVVSVTTPAAATPVFSDGFESGDLSAWTSSAGLVVEGADVRYGGFAAEGNTTTGNTFARKTLATTYPDAYARVAFEIKSQATQVNLLRLRDATGASIGYVYVSSGGKLGFHNDTLNTNTLSSVPPGAGWHAVELHVLPSGSSGAVDIWLDGAAVSDLSSASVDVGSAPVGQLQVGETSSGTYDVVFDDAAFGTSRLGPVGDVTAPSVPGNVVATATSSFAVQVGWDASTDAVGVTGYDVLRDAVVAASLGTVTSWTDSTVQAGSTHTYAVRARDAAGNVSAASAAVSVTTPVAAAPLFSDGFESGNLSAWSSSAGLVVEGTDVRSGGFAAEGNTTTGNTFAKRTLPSTYADAYARVGFEVKSQASQINLLRLRDTAGTSIGYVYLATTGKLGFHADAPNTNTASAVAPGPGWHSLELHVAPNGLTGVVEVWLDGVAVAELSSTTANVGTAPVGQLQIGETQTGRTYDVVFDDAAFSTSRIGP